MGTHTPGPWVAKQYGKHGEWQIETADRQREIAPKVLGLDGEDEANARLMAISPELLDGLRTYAEHKPACAWMARYGNPDSPTTVRSECDCGLATLLSRASGGADRG